MFNIEHTAKMPSPPWTNPDQDEFLESRLNDFLAAQREKATTKFWKKTYRDFFDKWADPEDEIPVITVSKKRKRKAKAVPEQTHTEWVQMRKQVSQTLLPLLTRPDR